MKPNKAEIDALRDVLMTPLEEFVTDKERESHKDPESLAQTRMFTRALEAVDEARGQRTHYMVVLRFGQGTSTLYLGYGPYATKAQAEKAQTGELNDLQPTAYAVVPMRNQEGVAQLWAEVDKAPEPRRLNKTEEKQKLAELNSCIHKDKYHLRAGHKEIKPVGNVWELREREGI